jgi:hypothetical protein
MTQHVYKLVTNIIRAVKINVLSYPWYTLCYTMAVSQSAFRVRTTQFIKSLRNRLSLMEWYSQQNYAFYALRTTYDVSSKCVCMRVCTRICRLRVCDRKYMFVRERQQTQIAHIPRPNGCIHDASGRSSLRHCLTICQTSQMFVE